MMKCKYCVERLTAMDVQRGRCPYCGGAVMVKPRKKMPFLFWIIVIPFLLVGALVSVGGVESLVRYETNKEHYVQVDATIVQILREESYDSVNDETDVDYTVFVDYEYGGKEYKHVQLDYYNSSMRQGERLQIEIDSRDPGTVVSNNWWIMLVGGFVSCPWGRCLVFGLPPWQKSKGRLLLSLQQQ